MEENLSASSKPQSLFAGRNIFLSALFRLLIVYLFLSNWIWVDELIVNPTRPVRPVFNAVFGRLARWTGYHLFHLAGPINPNSFRDTRYLYLVLFCVAVSSVLITIAWIIFDRRGRYVPRAYELLRVWIRYTLAYMILIYAMDKVFRLQFPFPSIHRLIEPLGDFSPMSLLWTYVGYSGFMTVFSGLAEAAGAVLLLFRRTAPLGAMISLVMMANVALMDFCYDVSVKMLAAHFLFMSIFLLSHDAERLLNVLAFNRTAPARDLSTDALSASPARVRRFLPILKVLVVLYVIVPVTVRTYRAFRQGEVHAAHVPFYGLYAVTSFTVNGADHPLLINDSSAWRYVIIESPGEVTIKTMNDTLIPYNAKYDPARSRLEIHRRDAGSPQDSLVLSQSTHGDMLLTGDAGQEHIDTVLHPIDVSNFTLVNRGFNWINETSFSK